ncbi:hypothetical protein PINS_up022875 [Pythium insidiosum]|nr:hypothetical protein PINS_up022875 [Pythium insidiosum]
MAPIASEWKLQLIARCAAFRSCLSASDNDRVDLAVAASSLVPEELVADDLTNASVTSAHLERYKQWKLADDKIEELTAIKGDTSSDHSSSFAAVDGLVDDLQFFARGKRGVLYAGRLKRDDCQVVVKFAGDPKVSSSSAATNSCWLETEAKWLAVMNRVGIGAQLVACGTGWMACELVDGLNVVDFLATMATQSSAYWVLREMLCQCFTIDMMGINKEEMTHPTRHIIVHAVTTGAKSKDRPADQRRHWRCVFIDFEKCSLTKKPKNVTQICQVRDRLRCRLSWCR